MERTYAHLNEMREQLEVLYTTLSDLQSELREAKASSAEWSSRWNKVEALRLNGWMFKRGKVALSPADQTAAEALLQSALENYQAMEKRASAAQTLLNETTARRDDLKKAIQQLESHSVTASLVNRLSLSSNPHEDVQRQDVLNLLKDARRSAYTARAFIEIGAGK